MDDQQKREDATTTAWLDQQITFELTQHNGDVATVLHCLRGKHIDARAGMTAWDARHLGGVADGLQIARMVVEAAEARDALASMDPDHSPVPASCSCTPLVGDRHGRGCDLYDGWADQ
ncbi:MAG: hypothetical protein FWF90_11505 [Promicromonosporaceae bacterium]|nr:hypothetical protein [Promicromonosporaceae bacterium]